MKLMLGAFLLAHALIHVSYLTPAPPQTAGGPEWPFAMARSWLVTGIGLDVGVIRALGVGLVVATIALLGAAALATVGWLLPPGVWPILVAAGAATSALTLAVFFHPWIVIGLLIDAVLLWSASVAGWTPEALGP
jgi:hypothetical protein